MSLTAIEAVILAGIDQGQTLAQLGDQLSLSHSAVSKALQAAQTRERLRLVDHAGRRISLTPAGKVLALRAREVVLKLADLNELLVGLQTGRGGPLHIIAAPSSGNYVLPDIISEFGKVFPQVQVNLAVVSSRELWRIFAEQNYDLGIGPRPDDAPGWLVEPLYDDGPVFSSRQRRPSPGVTSAGRTSPIERSSVPSRSRTGQTCGTVSLSAMTV